MILDQKLFHMGFVWQEKNPIFYIINSCSVTGKAEREVRQHIYQIRKKFPKTIIVVTGCAATNWIKNNITVNGVDVLVENDKKESIPALLQTLQSRILTPKRINPELHKAYQRVNTLPYVHDKFLASGRLMIKIQDGCDRFCSYCIVAHLRGKPHSRTIKEIIHTIKEYSSSKARSSPKKVLVRQLAGSNNKISEVILTAINTECFGKDTGETLGELIDAILTQTSIPNISFGSIHPWSITDEFLAYYQTIMPTNRFVPFFHIPIQSGSNKMLQLMTRGYTKEELSTTLKKIRSINPDAFIGTDIIVGFPGETEKEFNETYEFLKTAAIDKIHVFRFSARPGTAAEKLCKVYGEPTPQEKQERAKRLRELKK